MKVCISADIEGIAGMVSWDEADPANPAYAEFRDRMTAHVAAACEGAQSVRSTSTHHSPPPSGLRVGTPP
jgi:D-aminopeptidase